MNTYYKPYIENIYGASKTGVFPYTREQLCERPIFPTFIMDGGARFFTRQVLDIRDGDDMLEKIMDGSIFDYYRRDGVFNWCSVLNDFRSTDFLHEWEAHIWLARMYILLPVAQKFLKTRDRKYSDAWYKIFSHWKENNPHYDFDRNVHRFNTTMVWSDMQTVWRTLNLIYSVFMLSCDKECFTPSQWCEIYESLKLHAKNLYAESVWHAERRDDSNHNLQLGTCMVMLGTMYPELEHAEDFIAVGKRVVSDNLELAIFPDGESNEDALSYLPFISRLYVESQLLLTKNGYEGIAGLEESLNAQYGFLYQFSAPDGTTLQIGDSYAFNVMEDIDFVKRLIPLTLPQKKTSCIFADSRMTVLRNKRFDVFVDGMEMRAWHQHFGRMSYIVFIDGHSAVCDSGCINYDCHDLREFLNSAQAHNTVSVDGTLPIAEFAEKPEITESSLGGDVQYVTYVNKNEYFTHKRTFTLYEDRLEVTDKVDVHKDVTLTNNLHVPGTVIGYYAENAKNQPVSEDSTLFTRRILGKLLKIKTSTPFRREFVPCVNSDSLPDWCNALRMAVKDGEAYKTVITLE